jgi:UDP-3-O-[3-hydroxymyristoyl] glucosamine N-acyltransferase
MRGLVIIVAEHATQPDSAESGTQALLCGRPAADWLLDSIEAAAPDQFAVTGNQPGVTLAVSSRYPLLQPATITRAIDTLPPPVDGPGDAVLIAATAVAPWWSGRPEPMTVAVVYTGQADCADWLAESEPAPAAALAARLAERGGKVVVIEAGPAESLRVDEASERQLAEVALYQKIAAGWQDQGVIIDDPATTRIDATVQLGQGTRIRPHTELTGATVVGAGASIGPVTSLANTTAGDACVIRYAVCDGVTIGAAANVGPFTWIRSGTRLGARCRAGSFVELADSVVGDGTQIPHVGGLLGAVVGKDCNIAGLSGTANFDGQAKHVVRIGDHVCIGASNMLVAPLTIGDGAYTAAGSIITDDVPSGALAIGRAHQVNVDDWVVRKMPGTPAANAAAAARKELL